MKIKYKRLTMHVTLEDLEMTRRLREKHGVNISGMFKIFLYHLEQQLEKIDYKSGIK